MIFVLTLIARTYFSVTNLLFREHTHAHTRTRNLRKDVDFKIDFVVYHN